MNNPLAWSPAQRCLAASGINVVFALLYLAVYAYAFWYPEGNPEVNQAFLPTAAWVVALTGCGMSLLSGISYRLRQRLAPSPWLTIATIALCTWVVIFSTYFYGLFTHLYAGVAIVAAWVVGLTLFSAREMWVNLLSTLFFNSVLLMGAYAGQIPYAPFFNTTAASIGQVNPGLLRPMNAITMLLLAVVLAIVYFIVARWKQREAELLAVGETLGKANAIISRYVAVQLADEVRNGNYAAMERHERRKLTLFFSDIKDFSTIADAIEPEDLSLLLNDYLSEMTMIAQTYGATIDKFVGDAIMIFFGAPQSSSDRDQALRAVRMGVEMQHSLDVLRHKWVGQGITHPFHIRIGINTGQASVGAFGSQQRLEYTAIGRQVNLAARIQAHCLPDHVLISHSTWSLVHDEIACVAKGEADFHGSHEPVQIFEVCL
ncbi:MAG: adenylate/guanylate cyclase domain-containing protein [Polaromonas sp.]|nr:adenylate/guanylate cyclase domain-containing protein [Polaromonas sp.]